MRRHLTVGGLCFALAILIGGSASVFVAWRVQNTQDHNIQLARSHAATVTPQLQADPRFELVQCGGGTAEGGCFWVIGVVASEQDLAALRLLVDATHPPVHTLYQVRVEALTPLRQP